MRALADKKYFSYFCGPKSTALETFIVVVTTFCLADHHLRDTDCNRQSSPQKDDERINL